MFKKLVPVNINQHKKLKISNIQGFDFASNFHIASVMAHEFVRAAAIYPIVFLEDKEQDVFRPVVLMGLDANQNLFVGDDGKWKASYIPAIIRRYPFALAKTDMADQYTVCIDEESGLLNEKDGAPLFNDDGTPSEIMENVKKYLGELQQMEVITRDFCSYMKENNMFTPLNMRVRQVETVKNIAGCYVINEERINNLSDERFIELRTKRYLPVVFAHLNSLSQIERLLNLTGEVAQPAPLDTIERVSEKEETKDSLH